MIAAGCALHDRTGHEAGRELLRKLYWVETGQNMPPILVGQHGKPYFADSPYHFSITHTPRHAFCVLARCPVGIDAEEADRPIRPELIRRVLSPAEQRRLSAIADRNRGFLTLWVLKEADAKRTGRGLQGFPNNTDFSPEDPRVHLFMDCLVALLADDPEEGVTFHAF